MPSVTPEKAMSGYSKTPAMKNAFLACFSSLQANTLWYKVMAMNQMGIMAMAQFNKVIHETSSKLK
jgi:hypothetical protein